MKLKNTSIKIIGIGEKALMPDEEILIDKAMLNNDSIKCLVRMGILTVDDTEERIKAAAAEAVTKAKNEEPKVTAPVQDTQENGDAKVPEAPTKARTPANKEAAEKAAARAAAKAAKAAKKAEAEKAAEEAATQE